MPVKLTDLKLSRFTLLQTAQSGHGKTTRSLTATRFGRVYVMDFDGKIAGAARGVPNGIAVDLDKIDVDDFSGKDFDAAIAALKALDVNTYATVVIDTFTELNDKALAKALGKKREQGGKPGFEEYGHTKMLLGLFFDQLMRLPCNIILNCHIRETEDEVKKTTKYGQAGEGSFKDKLPGKFIDSHYLYFDLGKYKIKVRNSDTYPVNTRIDDKFIDKDGCATVFDLSIFDDYAYRIKGDSK